MSPDTDASHAQELADHLSEARATLNNECGSLGAVCDAGHDPAASIAGLCRTSINPVLSLLEAIAAELKEFAGSERAAS